MDEVKSRPYNTRRKSVKEYSKMAGHKSRKLVKGHNNAELLNIYTRVLGRPAATKKLKGNKYLAKARSRYTNAAHKHRFGFAAKEAKGKILNVELRKVEKELQKEEAKAQAQAKKQTRAQAQARAKEYTRAKAQAAALAKAQALRERATEVEHAAGVNASAAYASRASGLPNYASASFPVVEEEPMSRNNAALAELAGMFGHRMKM